MNRDSIKTLMTILSHIKGDVSIVGKSRGRSPSEGTSSYSVTIQWSTGQAEIDIYDGPTHNIPEALKQITLTKLNLLKTFAVKNKVIDEIFDDMKGLFPALFTEEKDGKKIWTNSEIYDLACELWDNTYPRQLGTTAMVRVVDGVLVHDNRAPAIHSLAKDIVRRILDGEFNRAFHYILNIEEGDEFDSDETMIIVKFANKLLDKISPEAYMKWKHWQDEQVQETLKAKMSATKPDKSVKDISDEHLGGVAGLIEKAQQIVDGVDEGLVNMVTPNFVVEEFNKGLTKMFSILADSIAPTIHHNNSLARTGSYLAIEAYLECIALGRHAEKALTLMDDELNRTLLRVIIKRILASGLTETLADKDESMVAEWDKMATVFGVIDEDDTTLSTILAEVELEHGKALNDNQIEFLTILIHLANNVANYSYFREFIEEEQESQKIRKANKKPQSKPITIQEWLNSPSNPKDRIGDELAKKMSDFWKDPNASTLHIDFSNGKVTEGNNVSQKLLDTLQEHVGKITESLEAIDTDRMLTSLEKLQKIFKEKEIKLGVSPFENIESAKDFHDRNMPFYRSLMGMSKNSSGCSCGGKGCKK